MPLLSHTGRTSSGNSQTPQGEERSKIQTLITERNDETQMYSGDPQDMEIPEFVRTGSYYVTGRDEPDCKYFQASDVRRQVQQAPTTPRRFVKYLNRYHNGPRPLLHARRPFKEYPIAPSHQNGSAPGNFVCGDPGPVRAFYSESDRSEFDIGYREPPRGLRKGKKHPDAPYSLASYHPAPTYTDTSTIGRVQASS
ncbi:hypothetical protein SAPIO_CDS3186 [Scedosporium apiospermum]|uniref:Uncharacterized protein n=1 Tax=Pseudallescheria apiosperma TaxID=563466 RepID=A0A084GA81_PSEDA|nr:uncharacterized protein SAPIO_CDS3186 [Scedosporium apiospermum]KEZ44243.1 hypothetical protein SAPIO_CDS3186 [Scedosporium apiospermum]